jgi:hypothetical protein
MLKIVDNFLDQTHLSDLQALIFDLDFPWRIREGSFEKDEFYLTYNFFCNFNVGSEHFTSLIRPILFKLGAKAVVEARTNCLISKVFDNSLWHADYDNCVTTIVYLNDADGGTELNIDGEVKFIKAVENRAVIFDSNILHRARTSKTIPRRYILNLNYYV